MFTDLKSIPVQLWEKTIFNFMDIQSVKYVCSIHQCTSALACLRNCSEFDATFVWKFLKVLS